MGWVQLSKGWNAVVAEVLLEEIIEVLSKRGSCDIMLTGGDSASKVYEAWSKMPDFYHLKNTNFYISDERCVDYLSEKCNSASIEALINKIPKENQCHFFGFKLKIDDYDRHLIKYNQLLPGSFDILMLSFGADGHIASLFPGSKEIENYSDNYVYIHDSERLSRLTITPKVISNARQIILLVVGWKRIILYLFLSLIKFNPSRYPSHLMRGREQNIFWH